MVVALATLETNVYTTLFNHLTSGTYSLIPSTISSSRQVVPVYSDNIASKEGFPIIELADPIISDIVTNRFGDVQKSSININILIVEDNAADGKATADTVKNKFLTGYSVFKEVGLHKMKGAPFIADAGKTIIHKNMKHYHYKRYTINFEYRERLD